VNERKDLLWHHAAVALWRIDQNEEAFLRTMQDAMKSENKNVRSAAVSALNFVGQQMERAVPLLNQALEDPDPEVRGEARHALDELAWVKSR
jgi:HEAT repeat protein